MHLHYIPTHSVPVTTLPRVLYSNINHQNCDVRHMVDLIQYKFHKLKDLKTIFKKKCETLQIQSKISLKIFQITSFLKTNNSICLLFDEKYILMVKSGTGKINRIKMDPDTHLLFQGCKIVILSRFI